jgi:adsorption protein B
MILDHWIASLLAPLAFWVLCNGLDDLVVDIAAFFSYIRRILPSEKDLDAAPTRRMAVFVALWKEHRVIQKMIENNVTKLRYESFEFFVGAYPNDAPTVAAIREAMQRFPNVHLSICPHDGPTSKADCLNWIYQTMLLHEEKHDVRFDMILTHDAEDLMDPEGLRWINYYAQWYDMVQIPVLALPTPIAEIAHGVYCDEFAEFQFKDTPARELLGGFIPSNGVGTGFSRASLERLAEAHENRVFEPACLTEDYENGWRIHRMGLKQKFVPIHFRYGRALATREYFPRAFAAAVRQRTRWITGIALQSWEFHTPRETLQQLYWFWRDRKGLIGSLITPLMNILFLYGAGTFVWDRIVHAPWGLAREISALLPVYMAGFCLQIFQTSIRTGCSARIYGWRFAAAVPLRTVAGNWINGLATARAIWNYANAKAHGRPLRWAKTEHNYPTRAALNADKRRLSEIITGSQRVTPEQLELALASKPAERRLGEHLMHLGLITEADLYTALSLQNDLPLGKPEWAVVSPCVARAFPAVVAQKWRVLPFRIAAGELHVAGSELPDEEMRRDMRRFSSLEIRFHLVTPTEFEELAGRYLA